MAIRPPVRTVANATGENVLKQALLEPELHGTPGVMIRTLADEAYRQAPLQEFSCSIAQSRIGEERMWNKPSATSRVPHAAITLDRSRFLL